MACMGFLLLFFCVISLVCGGCHVKQLFGN